MKLNPFIPVWMMAVICLVLLCFKRKGWAAFIRQFIILLLLFTLNLRIMVPNGKITVQTKKMDAYVLFVIDDTLSMVAADYDGKNPRIEGVKNDCNTIIDTLYGSKFAVISFNNDANLLTPFSSDANHIKNIIDAIQPLDEFYAKGTTLNVSRKVTEDTLASAADRKDGKVIIFFISDGEITGDEKLKSFDDLAEYVDGGAVLGYGTEAGGKMYYTNYWGEKETVKDRRDFSYKDAKSKLDEDNLKSIAEDIGVDYYHMENKKTAKTIAKEIEKDLNSDFDGEDARGYSETYYWFAIPIVLMLLYEFIDIKRKE